jgi:beta-glucosidase
MPGPTRFRGNALGHDITCNKISRSTIDARARSMLELIRRCAPSSIKENSVERELNTPQTSALLRKIASDCIVLMKNDNGLLPLSKTKSVSQIRIYD